MNEPNSVQVHRFYETVAVSFLGVEGATVYLPPALAARLAGGGPGPMNATPSAVRLRRVLAVLRADRAGVRHLDRLTRTRWTLAGLRASPAVLAEGLRSYGEGLARIHAEEARAAEELREAGALVRVLLSTPAPNPNPESIRC